MSLFCIISPKYLLPPQDTWVTFLGKSIWVTGNNSIACTWSKRPEAKLPTSTVSKCWLKYVQTRCTSHPLVLRYSRKEAFVFHMCVSSAISVTGNYGCFDGVLNPVMSQQTRRIIFLLWKAVILVPHHLTCLVQMSYFLHVVIVKHEECFGVNVGVCVFVCCSGSSHGHPPLSVRCGSGPPPVPVCVSLQVLHLHRRWVQTLQLFLPQKPHVYSFKPHSLILNDFTKCTASVEVLFNYTSI